MLLSIQTVYIKNEKNFGYKTYPFCQMDFQPKMQQNV